MKRDDLLGSATAIQMTNPTNNPFLIGVQENPIMGCWEITVTIGNFDSEAAATRAAKEVVVPALEQNLGMKPASFAASPGEGSA